MRIIAGERKGHTIYAPKGLDTRPTSDRVRENVFNIVAPWVEDARVLDLSAGSGAMGLEALSRGAAVVLFVESDRNAARTIERNLDKLRRTGATVLRLGASAALTQEVAAGRKYDLVLESSVRSEPALPGLEVRTTRKYGSTRVTVFEHE